MAQDTTLIRVEGLTVSFVDKRGVGAEAVRDVSFSIDRGEKVGVVGESGSGKSVSARALFQLISLRDNVLTDGQVRLDGDIDLLDSDDATMRTIRGRRIALVPQEPMSALNPVKTCGDQISEALRLHTHADKEQVSEHMIRLLQQVKIEDATRAANSYPHELSGGQQQRVCIAMALAGSPDLLVCDEPTTALDIETQTAIVKLLAQIVEERQMAMLFISHDIGLVERLCDRVLVMHDGKIVEQGNASDIFTQPKHRYTRALLQCRPAVADRSLMLPTVQEVLAQDTFTAKKKPDHRILDKIILAVANLSKAYRSRRVLGGDGLRKEALKNVSLNLKAGEIFGIVGPSGSGKSTLVRCISGELIADDGDVIYDGPRSDIQMIFQDPYSSLNPRMTVGDAVSEPLRYHQRLSCTAADDAAKTLLSQVGISGDMYSRLPSQLSGGQRQRVCIARAIAMQPKVLICDESVSALDVSVQAQILNLLIELRAARDLSILFVSHDRSVIDYLCDRVVEMRDGQIIKAYPLS